MLHFLAIGTLLGLSAGLSPGPLLMLVVSETLHHGTPSGVRVALAPVVTDLPIVLATLALLARFSGYREVLGAISLAGAVFVLFTAVDAWRSRAVEVTEPKGASRSLGKGVLANLLSPHPYLFWIGVGAPLLWKSLAVGLPALFAFVASFYLALVGSKVLLALAVGSSRHFLGSRTYLRLMRLLGLLLAVFALLLVREGARLLGWLSPS